MECYNGMQAGLPRARDDRGFKGRHRRYFGLISDCI